MAQPPDVPALRARIWAAYKSLQPLLVEMLHIRTFLRGSVYELKPSDLIVFEHDKEFVLEAFRRGEFDAVEVVSEIAERNFFHFLGSEKLLQDLAESYPTPRVKEEVPVWFYVASDLALRLHGHHSFHAFPYVIRSGGLLSLLSPRQAQRRVDPANGDLHLQCEGFNAKNHYERETPCDADFLRKMARDTKPAELEHWFGQALPRAMKSRRAFDREGIFIGDGSYLFVPDNAAYEDCNPSLSVQVFGGFASTVSR